MESKSYGTCSKSMSRWLYLLKLWSSSAKDLNIMKWKHLHQTWVMQCKIENINTLDSMMQATHPIYFSSFSNNLPVYWAGHTHSKTKVKFRFGWSFSSGKIETSNEIRTCVLIFYFETRARSRFWVRSDLGNSWVPCWMKKRVCSFCRWNMYKSFCFSLPWKCRA